MTRAIALLFVGGLLSIGTPRPTPGQQGPGFTLVLEKAATGWSAHCTSGCTWSDLTFNYAGYAARISTSGVSTEGAADPDTTGFAFTVRSTPTGWTATASRGTAWRTVSWQCPTAEQACRARITATGVGGD